MAKRARKPVNPAVSAAPGDLASRIRDAHGVEIDISRGPDTVRVSFDHKDVRFSRVFDSRTDWEDAAERWARHIAV